MEDMIARIYPENTDEVQEGIAALKNSYRQKIKEGGIQRLTEADCILITYGDGISKKNEAPLATLSTFGNEFLKEIISAIHLLPCFPYSSDDGFSVIDYYEIDPNLGDWDDVKQLESDFELMFDAVVNHISKSSDWFKKYEANEPPYHKYFIEADPQDDHSKVVRPRALPLLHPFDKAGKKVYVWTTFSEDQVDLNYKDYRVFLHVLDVLLFYISKGARYIRLDAIAFLWKENGTSCIHLDQTHWVIQAYRSIIEELSPEVILITETNVPHKENIAYFGNGFNEAHMVYNFTLPPLLAFSIHQQSVTILAKWAQSLELPSSQVCFFNFTASHDGIGVRPLQGIVSQEEISKLAGIAEKHGGFVSYKTNEDGSESPYELNCNYLDLVTDPAWPDDLRIKRFLLTQSVMLSMPGVPGIYYHSLLGSENDRDAAIESGINRRINRKKLDYDTLVGELASASSLRNHIYADYAKLLKIRRAHTVFNPFAPAEYKAIDSLFIISRSNGGKTFYGLHNFSDLDIRIKALSKNVVDLLTDKALAEEYWTIRPFEFKWLLKK